MTGLLPAVALWVEKADDVGARLLEGREERFVEALRVGDIGEVRDGGLFRIVCSFIRLFVCSFIRLFVYSFIRCIVGRFPDP